MCIYIVNRYKCQFLILSISIFLFSEIINAQNYNFPDPYSEKINFNPAYSGLTNNNEFNLNYSKNFFSDIYSVSFNKYYDNYKSSIGFLLMNNRFGKGTLNNINISAIYGYKFKINYRSIINTAVQVSYLQQSVSSEDLIFSSQINPVSGIISPNTSEYFPVLRTYDFSVGTAYISNKYRTGLSVHHIDKIFFKNENFYSNPEFTLFFGKIFSVKKIGAKEKILITPEVIYRTQNNFHQIIYSVHGNYNIFLTRFFLKHNLNFNTFEGVITLGVQLVRLRFTYTYGVYLTKYVSIPVSTNAIAIRYNFGNGKKINIKNTIYCLNF